VLSVICIIQQPEIAKKEASSFSCQKPILIHFDPKILKKYPKYLDKPINNLKNLKHSSNQPEPENIIAVRFASSSKEKEKKHIGKTFIIKRNSLTLTSTILVARIVVN